MNKFLSITVATLLATTSLASAKNAAVINEKTVSIEEIKKAYENNPQVKGKISFEEFYPKALEIYVNGTLLLQDAKANGIEKDKLYQQQVEAAKDEIARKLYLEKIVAPKVTKKEIDKLYQEYKNAFKTQKEIKAKHILVEDQATATEVITRLNDGEDFVVLAKEYSKEPADLGYFTKPMMVKEFGDAAFSMKKGDVSKEPVKTKFGYHIIMVEDARDTKLMTQKEIEPQIKALVTQQAIAQKFQELYKDAKLELYDLNGKKIEQKITPPADAKQVATPATPAKAAAPAKK